MYSKGIFGQFYPVKSLMHKIKKKTTKSGLFCCESLFKYQ